MVAGRRACRERTGLVTRRRPTLSLVAARSGYSVSAVSQALKGRGRLGEEARARILGVADELGYVVNSQASSLRTGRTWMLGLQSSPWGEGRALSESPYFHRFANAAAVAAAQQGWTLVILPGVVPQDRITGLQLEAGLIVDPQGHENMLHSMIGAGGVLVTDGRFPMPPDPHPEARVRMVSVDIEAVLRLSLQVARDRGYSRPALITAERHDSYADDMAAMFTALCGPDNLLRTPPGQEAAAKAIRSLLHRPDRPDFIIATNMGGVFGALQAAQDCGIQVPGDLGLLTTSETPLLDHISPAVSSIDLGPEEMGRRLVAIAIALCEGLPVADEATLAPPLRFFQRQTTRD